MMVFLIWCLAILAGLLAVSCGIMGERVNRIDPRSRGGWYVTSMMFLAIAFGLVRWASIS